MPDHLGDATPQPEPFDLRSHVIAEAPRGLGDCMPGLDVRSPGLGVRSKTEEKRLALRGWQPYAYQARHYRLDDRIESPVATTVETMTDKAGGRCFQWRDAGGVVYDTAERRAGEFDS